MVLSEPEMEFLGLKAMTIVALRKKSNVAPPPQGRSWFPDSRPKPERWSRAANHERQRLVLDPLKMEIGSENLNGTVVNVNKPNPFGAARPREEVLAEKGLDWKKMDKEIEVKKAIGSRPMSSQSSRPGSSQSARSEGTALQGGMIVKPRPKVFLLETQSLGNFCLKKKV